MLRCRGANGPWQVCAQRTQLFVHNGHHIGPRGGRTFFDAAPEVRLEVAQQRRRLIRHLAG
jgi:hypothetical protein